MFEEIHHFGITVHDQKRSRRFYSQILKLPWLGETVNRGGRYDHIYKLDEAVNRITWYQIGYGGIETFYLPRHPSRESAAGGLTRPGYRYIAFRVDGFNKYTERLLKSGLSLKHFDSRDGRCALASDPDGINILFFDTGVQSLSGHVSSLKEIGLVVSNSDIYEAFFNKIGLWRTERDSDFIEPLFGIAAPAPLYGAVRLIASPGPKVEAPPSIHCVKPAPAPRAPFSDVGIKHIAYSVSDADEFYKRGVESGIDFLFEPAVVSGGGRIIYFLDPEGNTFEAMQQNPAMRILARSAGAAKQLQIDVFSAASNLFSSLHPIVS
jgi:catechol 2,3-dioxygenase-like lactoylglutathione lyase family enzyme